MPTQPTLSRSDSITLGWDIGGAHLKIAVVDQQGHLLAVEQHPCALWRGLDQLTPLVSYITQTWGPCAHHAVTMSGEMVDLFSDRIEGVRALLQTFASFVDPQSIHVYCAHHVFLSIEETEARESEIASANWLASAAWAAKHIPQGILLDIGSTTTDVLCFKDGIPQPCALGDADRLISEELVYTGVTRTPLMALAQKITWRGKARGVMAELFATTADVYRTLGVLPQDADQHDTADGGPKTQAASMTRMARMIGLDGNALEPSAWIELAEVWQSLQQAQIDHALTVARTRISSQPDLNGAELIPVIVAGVGRFLVQHLDHTIDFGTIGDLIPDTHQPLPLRDFASRCAPAVAVAALCHQIFMA